MRKHTLTDPVNTAANHLSILIVTKLFNRDRMVFFF